MPRSVWVISFVSARERSLSIDQIFKGPCFCSVKKRPSRSNSSRSRLNVLWNEPQQDARFFVDASALSEFKAAIRKRGSLEMLDNGNAVWTCPVRDTAEALRWALETGVIPLAPDALTSVWKHANEEATHAN